MKEIFWGLIFGFLEAVNWEVVATTTVLIVIISLGILFLVGAFMSLMETMQEWDFWREKRRRRFEETHGESWEEE